MRDIRNLRLIHLSLDNFGKQNPLHIINARKYTNPLVIHLLKMYPRRCVCGSTKRLNISFFLSQFLERGFGWCFLKGVLLQQRCHSDHLLNLTILPKLLQ